MAPTVGSIHLLVAKNLKILRLAVKAVSKYTKGKLPAIPAVEPALSPAYARVPRQPLHPSAFLKQSRRWLSTHSGFAESARSFGTSSAQGASRSGQSSYHSSRVGRVIRQSSGRAPFASTLRPNLTGGAIPRASGGYTLGGGRRYFSHSPAAPAEVINNVSQAMRAFMLGGKQLQYDGVDRRTGEKRFKTVSATQDKATKKMKEVPRSTPGSYIDFSVNPTITAMAPMTMSSVAGFGDKNQGMNTLHTEGLLDILSIDFSRALQELALIMADLRALSSLGDLPISYQQNRLRIHFPGVDPETVDSLATELNIKRGIIGQDPDFDDFVGTEIALLFPFAPSSENSVSSLHAMQHTHGHDLFDMSSSTTLSDTGIGYEDIDDISLPSNVSESQPETIASRSFAFESSPSSSPRAPLVLRGEAQVPFEYQDFEGIYRFIELCDNARR